jgi:UDP-N-acetylmuramoyl-L-alanyl-D-glutamate--2,6-diaminopimelate ligase
MGAAAARFNRAPSGEIKVIGVTGTNGKTTTAWIVRSLIESCGQRCGLIGTVATIVGGNELGAVRTTPEAIELHGLLRQMADAGDTSAAIEVSSHALELGRVDGVDFAAAVFTNLTQDHLDFHGDLESYWQSKKRLFTEHEPKFSIVNIDDPKGRELAAELKGAVTFGLDSDADWSASAVATRIDGSSFTLSHPHGKVQVDTRLPGLFNVRNVLAALAAVSSLGFELEPTVEALAEVHGVPGRFENIVNGQPFAVLVDYAHTPDSLENVLKSARALTESRVICVVGCGGDRDRSKRPLMGGIAAELSDLAIITSDNPRSEDPQAIIDEVAAGATGRAQTVIDREDAIRLALTSAEPGDVVLIAGKGHEQGQEFADGIKVPFDDRKVAASVLTDAGWSR